MINFKVIIPVFNSQDWISKCLESLISQKCTNWQSVVIDDNSTDGTLEQIKSVIKKHDVMSNFKVLKRSLNVGALENIVYGISMICSDDEDVIVLLDGDDWFPNDEVLSYLNDVYLKEDVWVTYGSFESHLGIHSGFCKPISVPIESYRKSTWVTSHLRTFKYWLWKNVKNEDLKDHAGKYYSMAWDMAIMFPLLEMSGMDKIKFIDRIMYVYNDMNPINDFRKNIMNQISTANEIKSKKPYSRIEKK